MEKFKRILIDSSESVKAVLGRSQAENYLFSGELSAGFLVLSDQRVYAKGKFLTNPDRGTEIQSVQRTIELKNVIGVDVVEKTANWAKILRNIFLIEFLSGIVGSIIALFALDIELFAFFAVAGGLIGGIAFGVFASLAAVKNYSIVVLRLRGESLGLYTSAVSLSEIDQFRGALALLKEKEPINIIEEAPPVVDVTATVKNQSIPSQLKEYKELLDLGIITKEEYEAKKAKLLDL